MEWFAAGFDAAPYDGGVVAEQQEPAPEQRERGFAVLAEVALEAAEERDEPVVTDADRGGEQVAIPQRADDLVGEDALSNDQR